MKIETKYNFGDTVYFRTDSMQQVHIITGFIIEPGNIIYKCSNAGIISEAFDFEITKERNQLKSLGIEE